MKRTSGIGFLLVFSLYLVSPAFMIGWFQANQARIAAEHCVNKDKPELNCNGKCYLNKQLSQSLPADPDQEQPLTEVEFPVIPVFASPEMQLAMLNSGESPGAPEQAVLYTDPHLSRLFRPPRIWV